MPIYNHPSWAAALDATGCSAIVDALSVPRLTKYGYEAAAQNYEEAVALHARNIVLSESLYPIFHLLEIVVRNQMHKAFTAKFGTPEWFNGAWVAQAECDKVSEARRKLVARGRAFAPDDIIASVSFGFWCGLLDTRYEINRSLWPSQVSVIVPSAPRILRSRKILSARMEKARRLRNRIFHHEPISHWQDIQAQRDNLFELLDWISPATRRHAEHLCRFRATFAEQLA